MSARKRDGLDVLVRKIVEVLPTGQRYYPKDQYTDQPLRFMVAELIRESILIETGEEVPYASAVVIEQFEEPKAPPRPGKRPLTRIAAVDLLRARRAKRRSSSARADRNSRPSAQAHGAKSSRSSARRSISSCMSSSSRAGASRERLSSLSTGAISWRSWPQPQQAMRTLRKKNGSAPRSGRAANPSAALLRLNRHKGGRDPFARHPGIGRAAIPTQRNLCAPVVELHHARSCRCALVVDHASTTGHGKAHHVLRIQAQHSVLVKQRSFNRRSLGVARNLGKLEPRRLSPLCRLVFELDLVAHRYAILCRPTRAGGSSRV